MKKILVVGPGPSTSRGGIAEVTQQMLKSEILNKKLQVTEYTSYKDGGTFGCLMHGIWRILRFPFAAADFDVIHIQMAAGGSVVRKAIYCKIAKKMKKKIIVQLHSSGCIEEKEKQKEKTKKWLKEADHILVPSEYCKEQLEEWLFGEEKEERKISFLPNGIDVEAYTYNDEGYGMLYLGRISKEKGCFDILEALAGLKYEKDMQPVMIFAGSGEEEEERLLRELIADCRLRRTVALAGWKEGKEKKDLLERTGVMLFPSCPDGIPVSMLEAMASGNSIILPDTSDCQGLVEGATFIQGDIRSLKKAIYDTLTMSWQEKRKKTKKNRKLVEEKFDLKKIHRQLVELYNKI